MRDETVEFGYCNGYTMALLRLKELVDDGLKEDCRKHRKPFTVRTVREFIQCAIDNRVILRENPFVFIRCCGFGKECKFEVYDPTREGK